MLRKREGTRTSVYTKGQCYPQRKIFWLTLNADRLKVRTMFLSMKIVGFWYHSSVEVNEAQTVTTVKMRLKKFVKLVSYGILDVKYCIW